ncbi:hypothetical protein [Vibrio taketomensis]|uniref:hypothetical protein n=1 Tax=Vibrio taketomensis TaxID=2572923 RepID=UPI001E2F61D4|nr:hypothetical protein [Vibrio taketomensis]
MKKALFTTTLLGSLVLMGCSSSNNDRHTADTEATPDRLPPTWHEPEDAVNTPERLPPIWGGPEDTVNTPDRNPPMWSGPTDDGNTPDRLPPTWHAPEDQPTWGGPETSYTINGDSITDIDGNQYTITKQEWRDNEFTVQDSDGNEYTVRRIKSGEYEGGYFVFSKEGGFYIGGDTVQGGINTFMEKPQTHIDRDAIRNNIRQHLNK